MITIFNFLISTQTDNKILTTMELNWKESKQDNNKDYTKHMIGIVENGLPNNMTIKVVRIFFNNGNNIELYPNNKEVVIKILNDIQDIDDEEMMGIDWVSKNDKFIDSLQAAIDKSNEPDTEDDEVCCLHKYECGCDKQTCMEMDGEECDTFCGNEYCKHYYDKRNDNCNCNGNDCPYCNNSVPSWLLKMGIE